MEEKSRLDSIEAMRGIAALAVVVFHFNGQLHIPILEAVTQYGWLGVDVFFVITGFVIPYSLWGRGHSIRQFPAYMARRIVRLEPPYIASILLIVALIEITKHFGAQPFPYNWTQVAYHLFYAIPLTDEHWLNTVYWTLAYEFVFYLIVGVVFETLIRRNVLYTLAFAAMVIAVRYWIIGYWDFRAPLVILFLPGVLAMRYMVGLDSRASFITWTVACCLLLSWLRPWSGLAAAATVSIILLTRGRSYPRALMMLGAMSYSLYLTHTVIGSRVINLGKRFGEGLPTHLALFLLALAVSIGFAALFALVFERPAARASHKIAGLRFLKPPPPRGLSPQHSPPASACSSAASSPVPPSC
jgi:peptidoglycan/LPS O-acetylase OafA/YrhL